MGRLLETGAVLGTLIPLELTTVLPTLTVEVTFQFLLGLLFNSRIRP